VSDNSRIPLGGKPVNQFFGRNPPQASFIFQILWSFLFAPDKSIELVSEYPPAATDFLSLYFACGDILEVSRAGNFEIKAGFLRVKNYATIPGVRPSIKTVVTTVRCFAAILSPAGMLQFTFFSHERDL
jgi:hypothetical protein